MNQSETVQDLVGPISRFTGYQQGHPTLHLFLAAAIAVLGPISAVLLENSVLDSEDLLPLGHSVLDSEAVMATFLTMAMLAAISAALLVPVVASLLGHSTSTCSSFRLDHFYYLHIFPKPILLQL